MRISSSTAHSLPRNLYHEMVVPRPGHRPHPEFAADQARPLGHPGQAESAAGSVRSPRFRAEAAAIVLDGKCYAFSGVRFTVTFTSVACACFMIFASDSCTMR